MDARTLPQPNLMLPSEIARLAATTSEVHASIGTRDGHLQTRCVRGEASVYLTALTWGFAFFSTARILAYLPTLWAIYASGDASQHSLWTWMTWLGSNLTMAAWLHEQAGRRLNRAAVVSAVNALMCGAIVVLIGWHQW